MRQALLHRQAAHNVSSRRCRRNTLVTEYSVDLLGWSRYHRFERNTVRGVGVPSRTRKKDRIMNLAEYASYDALGLANLVRQKEVSTAELSQTAFQAIDAVNGDLNAIIETFPNGAPGSGADSDNGPFAGVPFLVKDVGLHFEGIKCEFCSRLCQGMVAAADTHYARLIRSTGVNIVGRTNTPEFSMSGSSENQLYGNTSTPWKLGHSANGSTGGGAAALAAGVVPIAHGSDIGGSIRGPASWCGGVGLKPSRARISSASTGSRSAWRRGRPGPRRARNRFLPRKLRRSSSLALRFLHGLNCSCCSITVRLHSLSLL